jgi:hypothetical protein
MEGDKGWVQTKGLNVERDKWLAKYVSSFYFIYATMTTVGYGDIAGLSTNERIFCVGIMILGGFLFGVLIGSVPAILDRRSEAGGRYSRLEKSLGEYLVDKKVPLPPSFPPASRRARLSSRKAEARARTGPDCAQGPHLPGRTRARPVPAAPRHLRAAPLRARV